MIKLFKIILLASLCAVLQGQASGPVAQFNTTVSGLASIAASSYSHKYATITDGASSCDMSVGGGTTQVLIVSNGSAWQCAGGVAIATSSTFGTVKPDNSTVTISGGVISAVTSAGSGVPTCVASNSGSPNALTCTIPAFTLAANSPLVWLTVTTPTSSTSVTLQINGGAIFTLYAANGNAPAAGEINPGQPLLIGYLTSSTAQIVTDSYAAGGSNCLTFNRTAFPWTVDINTGCVPQLTGANTFTGYNNFSGALIRLPETVVASLPSASANTGKEYVVTDGTSITDCSTGGSSTPALCRSNGTSWLPLGGSGGSSLTDACASGQGSFPFFGPPNTTAGAGPTIVANTIYGWEVQANTPLCTIDHLALADNGSGNYQVNIWNAAGTSVLASSVVQTMGSSVFQFPALVSSFQLQPNTTYLVTITGAHTGDAYFLSLGAAGFLTGQAVPRAFTCTNVAAWSGSNPNLPGSCGTRLTTNATAPIALLGYHN